MNTPKKLTSVCSTTCSTASLDRPLLIYIHGFLSSSHSIKAQQTKQYLLDQQLAIDFIAPDLSSYPGLAAQQLQTLLSQQRLSQNSPQSLPQRKVALIGSSMGGHHSVYLAEQFGLRAVVINLPAYPDQLIQSMYGEHLHPWSGQRFLMQAQHADELQQLDVPSLTRPENIWVMLQTDDETLDYREAKEKYQTCRMLIEEGGDHSFQGYTEHLPAIVDFLQL